MYICFLEYFFVSRSTSMKLPPKKFPAPEKLRTSLGKLTDELMMLLTPIPKQTTTTKYSIQIHMRRTIKCYCC